MDIEHYLTPEYLESIYGAEIIADSIAPNGARLTTTILRMWRPILAEHNTHRMCSRSVASSRALPAWKLIERVLLKPAVPVKWWAEHSGMQGAVELTGQDRLDALRGHLHDRDAAIVAVMRDVEVDIGKMAASVRDKAAILRAQAIDARWNLYGRRDAPGLSKQIVNRKLEPWMVVEIINSATDLENLFALRCHPAAESNFEFVAQRWRAARAASTPVPVPEGKWHLPFICYEDREWAGEETGGEEGFKADLDVSYIAKLKKLSVARCARVSYLNHLGVRDPADDIRLHDQLIAQHPPHAAAFEHVAQALGTDDTELICKKHQRHYESCMHAMRLEHCEVEAQPRRIGNFKGWRQYRFDVPGHVTEG